MHLQKIYHALPVKYYVPKGIKYLQDVYW